MVNPKEMVFGSDDVPFQSLGDFFGAKTINFGAKTFQVAASPCKILRKSVPLSTTSGPGVLASLGGT